MSQVRKLLKGQNIPKAQNGYKFHLDSQDIYLTDDQLREIDDQIAALPMERRRFLGNATNAIKNGNQSGNRANNTWTLEMTTGLDERNTNRLKKQKPSLWESLAPTDSYYAKQAGADLLNIIYSVANKPKATTETSKTTRYNRASNFDYDTDISGKQIYSNNPKNKFIEGRFSDYLDWLSDDTWGNSNQWETAIGENEPILRSWYSGFADRSGAETAIKAAMDEVRSKPWDEVSEATKELLAYFNIGNGSTSSTASSSGEQQTFPKQNVFDETGKIVANATNPDGTWKISKGDGKNGTVKDALYTSFTPSDSRPYLLNKDRLARFGLDDSYLNAVVYQNRIYKPEEVSQNVQLAEIMNNVITANNSAKNTNDVWETVGKILNFTDYPNQYISYNSDDYYMPYSSRALRSELGQGNYALADITNSYDTQGNQLYEIYDFNNNGTGQWGFRNPFYYIPTVGRLDYIPEGYTFLNRNWSPMNGYNGWETINGNQYGLVGNFWGADAHDTIPYQIFEDRQGNFWSRQGNGQMTPLDTDLVEWILQGNKPDHNQMLRGTLSGKRRDQEYRPGGGFARVHKEGGKVQLKPLPAKLQMGSRLSVAPNQPEQVTIQNDTPLAHASNIWETLTPADQKEITAAAIDVAGAIAGLVPGGSIAGAVSGLGSTGLFLSAAKDRKGHLDAGDWGQAALATGLDLVSLVPYLGETGKIAKVAKAVTRVAVPLGKAFNAIGLVEASSVLAKNPKDWDTNDLLKLSAGIQSVINIGHSARVRRGESALASKISTIRGKEKLPEVKYTSEKFKGSDGNQIELSGSEISQIIDKTNKTPAQTLRNILKSRGVTEDSLKDVTDDSLLKQFGFIVGKKGAFKWARTTAKQQPKQTREEYSKNGWLGDVFDPLANREFARREYIDNNLSDSNLRSKLGSSVLDATTNTITTPREIITTTSLSPKNTAAGRAYVQSLARLGQAETSWTARPTVKAQETTTVDRTPGMRADAEAAISRGEGLPNTSEMARSAGKLGLDSINEFAASTANINAGVSKAMGSAPGISNNPSTRLGAESVSSKELRKYIVGNAVEKGLSDSEAIEFLNGLSENKRRSVISELRKSKSQRAKDILSVLRDSQKQPRNRTSIKNTERLVKTVGDIKQRGVQRAFNEASAKSAQMALNLQKLRSSKNPMQTLSEISREPDMTEIVNMNPQQFREALNEALRNGVYKQFTGPRLDRNINRIEQQRRDLGLIFKKGGIIKAQSGTRLWELDDWHTPTFNDARTAIGDALKNRTQSVSTSQQSASVQNPDMGGGPEYNLPNLTKYLIPGLSLGRFALNSYFQNKYYRQAVDALNAGRVDKLPTILNAPRNDNPTLDRALQQVQLERMAGVKPVTSDVVANNALWNQREGQLWNREHDILGQRSAFDWDIKNRILEIENQNLANQIETANDNAMRRAAVNSAIKQQAMELTQRRGQSWENLGLEIQNNLQKDRNVMLNYNRAQYAKQLQSGYDNKFDQYFPGARAAYNALPVEEAAKYTDLEDYVRRTRQNDWAAHVNDLASLQEANAQLMQEWMYGNALNYSYPSWLTGRTSSIGIPFGRYKNGGTVKAQEGVSLKLTHPWKQNKRIETKPDGSIVGIIEEIDNTGTLTTREVLLQGPIKQETNSSNKSTSGSQVQSSKTENPVVNLTNPKPDILSTFSNFEPLKFSIWGDNVNKKSILSTSIMPKEYLPELYNQQKDYTDLVNVLEQLTTRYKKGGYLRGSTRYKNEPDEQIWIDNNKSTHKAIAKLSDNTIKLLLRALK